MHGNRDERDRSISRTEQGILADVIVATAMAQSPAQEVDAGLLIYRVGNGPEVLLVQPGGPFWSKKNGRTWSIPKGVVEPGDVLAAARRQFTNDTGLVADGDFLTLAPIEQKGGKILQGFAVECDLDLRQFRSSEFSLEWPPRLRPFRKISRDRTDSIFRSSLGGAENPAASMAAASGNIGDARLEPAPERAKMMRRSIADRSGRTAPYFRKAAE